MLLHSNGTKLHVFGAFTNAVTQPSTQITDIMSQFLISPANADNGFVDISLQQRPTRISADANKPARRV